MTMQDEFEAWLDNTVIVGSNETVAEWAWQACQALNDKRIAELEARLGTYPVPYEEVVESLIGMAWQYLENSNGFIDHQFMSAGESAQNVLESLGIVEGNKIKEEFKDYNFSLVLHLNSLKQP